MVIIQCSALKSVQTAKHPLSSTVEGLVKVSEVKHAFSTLFAFFQTAESKHEWSVLV